MEKLINVDALLKELQAKFDRAERNAKFTGSRDINVSWNTAICAIKQAPIVEAITVDWIEDWLDKITGTRDGEDISQLPEQLKFAIQMINLMEMDWRKENESISI